MAVKLIISDLDGTLLNEQKTIPADFWPLYRQLCDIGCIFAVASGRQYANMEKLFKPIADEIFFISENGALVTSQRKSIFETYLQPQSVEELIHLGRSFSGVQTVLCGRDTAFVECRDPNFIHEFSNFYASFKVVDNLLQVNQPIMKVAYYDAKGVEKSCFPLLQQTVPQYKITLSSALAVDVAPPNVNKGNAVAMLQSKLAIKPNETMVFGDYLNDFEMMRMAYYSYAMLNAHPQVKEVARFMTRFDNNNNGVIETIRCHLF